MGGGGKSTRGKVQGGTGRGIWAGGFLSFWAGVTGTCGGAGAAKGAARLT